jgi:hypothetical protein
MVMNVSLQPQRVIKATVRPDGTGRLVGVAPITLKNQMGTSGAKFVSDLQDINVVELTTGSSVFYNASTGKYDVRQPTDTDIADIDFGTF